MADGRAWPGFQIRFCPVCAQEVSTHRNPTDDERDEVVVYHRHWDTADKPCLMSGKSAALRAVAFTGAATGVPA
jgi:hypothetical protein